MAKIYESVAAATAVVGYDILQDARLQDVQYQRQLVSVRITGSAAAGDTLLDLEIGQQFLGTYANTNATPPGNREDLQDLGGPIVYPGEKIQMFVQDAPTTNPIVVEIETIP